MKLKTLRQVLRMSRYLFYSLFLQALLSGMLIANDGVGQHVSIYDVYVDITFKDNSLKQALQRLDRKVVFEFAYNEQDLDDVDKKISVTFNNASLGEVLGFLSKEMGVSFRRVDSNITVRKQEGTRALVEEIAIEEAQQVRINGKVTAAEDGEPLPGVSILVKGTSSGTTTDIDGNYNLSAPEGSVLQFSYIGFLTQEVTIGNQTTLNIALQPDMEQLEEVVVIGYGTQRKRDLTGSVNSFREDDFNPGGNVSVEQLLQGRTPGVVISQASNEPGGGMSVKIRGVTSVNASSEPLYVIDGLPIDNSPMLSAGGAAGLSGIQARNPLNSLNPNDIESIEILKDASATAIYGARGANGVILITTKTGGDDKTTFNYDGYAGVQRVVDNYELLDAPQYMTLMNDLAAAEGRDQVFTNAEMQSIQGTNWLDEIFRNAMITNHDLSLSGSNGGLSYYASLNYFKQEGVVRNTGIERYSARLNLDHRINDRINLGLKVNTSMVDNNNSIDGFGGNNESGGPLFSALLYDPTEPLYDENGELSISPQLTIQNPVRLVEGINSVITTNRTITNGYAEFEVLEGLKAKLNVGLDRLNSRKDLYANTLTFQGATSGGMADIASLERMNTLLEYTMTYNKKLNENSNITVLGGVTYQHFTNRFVGAGISGFPSDDTGTNNLNLGNLDNAYMSSNKVENKLLSYLGRVNYSLYDKYLLTVTFRADGSSRFGANNRFGYFPSVAAAWRLSEENFIPEFFDDLKLRASWGQIGNEAIGNLEYISTLEAGSRFAVINDSEVRGIQPSRVANPDLKWETTEQIDIGLDVSLAQGRIGITADYFIKNTSDMLYNLPLPQSTGFGSKRDNIGSMQNRGFELLLNTINIETDDLTWSTTLNFTRIQNEVTSLGGLNEVVGWYSIIREGEPIHSYYGYNMVGLFQEGDDIGGSAQPNAAPGEPKFKDVDGDNVIDVNDLEIIGNPLPDFVYGLQSSFSFKNFQFDLFIQGQEGASLLNYNLIESLYPQQVRRNRIATTALDRWTPENPDARWPSMVNTESYGAGRLINSMTIMDASYIRLKNARLGYNIPLGESSRIDQIQVYLVGQNLITITDYLGFDPEANAYGQSVARMDKSAYPLARTWLLGARFTF